MKKNITTILLVITTLVTAYAQTFTKLDIQTRARLLSGNTSGDMMHLLVKGDLKKIEGLTNRMGGHYKYGYGQIASVMIPEKNLVAFSNDVAVKKIQNPNTHGALLMDTARIRNNIDSAQAGYAPLPHDVQGRNVIVGIIDGGIYFQHPDFKNPDGTTRILNIWDQTNASGTAPLPYAYGSEWYSSDINSGNCQEVEPYLGSCADYGHGTCVAGIACGNGSSVAGDPFLAGKYTGVAPLSKMIVVNVGSGGGCVANIDAAVADAVDYIFKKADAYGMPCVINTSVGDYYGSHDGIDFTSEIIDSLLEQRTGRALVAAAGNAGQANYHLGYDIPTDSAYTFFNYNPYFNYPTGGVYFDWWSDTAQFNNASFMVGCNDNTGNNLGGTLYLTAHGDFQIVEDSTYQITRSVYDVGSNLLGTVNIFLTPGQGRYHFEVEVLPTNTNNWWRLQTTGSGHLDCWASSTFIGTSDIITQIAGNTIQYSNYRLPDSLMTMVSSWQNSNDVITVANYDNRSGYLDADSNFVNLLASPYFEVPGKIDVTSSLGPTRDKRLKPDVAATGTTIMCTGDLNDIGLKLTHNLRYKVGLGGFHERNGGTSMASPIVAGIVALYLELHPNGSFSEIKKAIINTAVKDTFTGPTANISYGNGKVNAFQALTNNGIIYGASDTGCVNYNASANTDTGGCISKVYGCTNKTAFNYDSTANVDNGSCFVDNCSSNFTLYADTYVTSYWYVIAQTSGIGSISYIWTWGDNSSPSAGTNPSHLYTDTGYYKICLSITDSIGCTANFCDSSTTDLLHTVNVVNSLPTGLQQLEKDVYAVSVYPNPASTQLFIQAVNFQPQWVTIYDMDGRKLSGQRFKTQLDISALSSGSYFIEIRGANDITQRKMFVKL